MVYLVVPGRASDRARCCPQSRPWTPPHTPALRGELTVNSTADATLNGNAIRMAPGMRLFSPQNTLVMAHTILGQRFKVNYVIEPSTGLLISAWILTKAEASQPRKASDSVGRNFRVESDTTPR